MESQEIFNDLFVLEMTNNHLGNLERGLRIVDAFSKVVSDHGMKSAIKLQFRDVDTFVQKDFEQRKDIYYVRRVKETKLSHDEFATLVRAIQDAGCIALSTPFDNASVDKCVEFGMPIIKVASSSSNDWTLLEKIASTNKPVIVSVGGAPLEDTDRMVKFFESKNIPLAINHCVLGYPHEDHECELSQIDFLKNRYPGHVIGYSSHEYQDWISSVTIAYAKGARTFERHIDINDDGITPSKYSSLPHQIDEWFRAYKRAKVMCGVNDSTRKEFLPKEIAYLDSYVRGVYAKSDLSAGDALNESNTFLAIPLQKGQISTREYWPNRYSYRLKSNCVKDSPITVDIIEAENIRDEEQKTIIRNRGI